MIVVNLVGDLDKWFGEAISKPSPTPPLLVGRSTFFVIFMAMPMVQVGPVFMSVLFMVVFVPV